MNKHRCLVCGRFGPLTHTCQDPMARFIAKTKLMPSGCIEWQGTIHVSGYGQFYLAKTRFAHRTIWMFTYGDIPPGYCVCHKCDNPRCVNINHLFVGTRADNYADMRSKNRHRNSHKGTAHPRAKLTDADVLMIRSRLALDRSERHHLAREYGVRVRTIDKIHRRERWKHL